MTDDRPEPGPDDEPEDGPEPASYAAAADELEELLRALERDDVDVDVLASHVARASYLITWCRARLDTAREAVAAVTDDE